MTTNPAHVKALRTELSSRNLDGFIIPLTDEHMSEYVGSYAQRLSWVTGFEGSAGNAVVLMGKGAIFVDGRYTLQVADQVDGDVFAHHHFQEYSLLKWVADNAPKNGKIGYDPELATVAWVETAEAALKKAGLTLVATDTNPIDSVWQDQPEAPLSPAYVLDDQYAGRSAAEKRADVAQSLEAEGADAAVISMLDSVAWAFNVRAADVDNTPVAHAFAVMRKDESATLFIDARKVDETLRTKLGNHVSIEPRENFYGHLANLGTEGASILVDRATNNAKIFDTLTKSGATLVEGQDPCILPKAVKNSTEQQGSRDAHIRDGAAITEFLHWLSVEADTGNVDELKAVAKLWSFRQKRALLQDNSFDTISASGPNGAHCHYRVDENSNRTLDMNSLYLVDSGGQYFDGTTDITRTIPVGTPTQEMRENFTRVLKGHIALSTTKFPKGTSGAALDAIARRPLWDAGLDYDHGTGHGVGAFLAVHEGPQRIAKGSSDVPLEPGMILSNEPGYYKAGEYGIRIENLVLVKALEGKDAGEPGRHMMGFETLTHAPIERSLVDTSLLTDSELTWLNAYHADVWAKISPLVEGAAKAWLEAATAIIAK
ncbi:aminopeptidase P family protein [Kordiimonas aquimaris]|uniref:aminopeptidase P family protein n=1 Tax=Kordiimonas aquimaris TaxID=707591 RepID=UPI0021D09BED|nr:aminopeptidase P family protein [Kordiimonas aquimaris]